MKKKTTKMRGMRLSDATYKAVVQAAKVRSYDSPSAFMRAQLRRSCAGWMQRSTNPNGASRRLSNGIRNKFGGSARDSRLWLPTWMRSPHGTPAAMEESASLRLIYTPIEQAR